MATGDFFGNLKHKVRSLYNNFFYEGDEAPAPRGMQEEQFPQDQQPYMQQASQQGYQQPQAAYPQQGYQQPYAQQAPADFYQSQPRNRRAQQHAAQQDNNVVDFGAYQQQAHQQYQQPQQNAYQSHPSYQSQQTAQQPASPVEQPAQQAAPSMLNARIINARGMADCRSAITLLRNGDAVMIVLENVTDPAEMRRLVDTLSGACYSLTATITKVSRYGVYLLAPQSMAVYADQATNQMNNPGRAAAARGYQPGAQRPAYQQPQQQNAPQAPNAYAPQQGFTQRTAQVEEAAQPFYARTAPQAAQVPSFSTQPAGYGYVPDEGDAMAVDQ